MEETMRKSLTRVSRLLLLGITLLVMAEVAFMLQGVFSYIAGVIGACLVLAVRFVLYKYKDEKGWKQRAMMALPIIAIAGPFAYILFQIFYIGSTRLWLELLVMVSFILPILIMFYCHRIIQKLIKTRSGAVAASNSPASPRG